MIRFIRIVLCSTALTVLLLGSIRAMVATRRANDSQWQRQVSGDLARHDAQIAGLQHYQSQMESRHVVERLGRIEERQAASYNLLLAIATGLGLLLIKEMLQFVKSMKFNNRG